MDLRSTAQSGCECVFLSVCAELVEECIFDWAQIAHKSGL